MRNSSLQGDKLNILVTGASGFIGKHFIKRFAGDYNIFCVVLPSENVEGCADSIQLDLKEKAAISAEFEVFNGKRNIDMIVHMAAEMADVTNTENINVLHNNIRMTEGLADIARLTKPRKIVNFSSMAVYPNSDGMYDERAEIRMAGNSDCLYGLSKFCGENLLDYLLRKESILISHLRISNVHGEEMRSDRVIPAMQRELKEKNSITVFGDGKRVSNFVSIKRLFTVIDLFIRKDLRGIFNVGEENVSFLKLAERIRSQSDRRDAEIIKIRDGSRVNFCLDTSKIDRILAEAEID